MCDNNKNLTGAQKKQRKRKYADEEAMYSKKKNANEKGSTYHNAQYWEMFQNETEMRRRDLKFQR